MALLKLSQYIDTHFAPGSQPDRRTVLSWIKRGELHGQKLGRDWYVDPSRQAAKLPSRSAPEKLLPLTRRILSN
jgi:hypothetical protein